MKAAGVLFCGGGTGGHIWPGLAVAEALRLRGVTALRWIGDPQRLEQRLVPAQGIPLLPWGLSRPRLARPDWWLRSLRQTWGCLHEFLARPPAAVVATGGYASLVPGLLAAWLRRPLVVLESNARPGRSNRLLARFARLAAVQFAEARAWLPAGRTAVLGNPVRSLPCRARGRGETLVLGVMGGSLAARSLNDLMVLAAPALAGVVGLSVIHLAGEEDRGRVAAAYAAVGLDAEVRGFEDDMPALYDRIDLALCRAGATSIAELCIAGIGALYIPLPWAADDHQTANARAVARHGGGVVLPQTKVTPAGLACLLTRLAIRRHEVTRLGRRAHDLARPDAAKDVAARVQAMAEGAP